MWKLNKSSKVLLDDSPEEEETRPRGPLPPAAAFAAPQVRAGPGAARLAPLLSCRRHE